jgi:hypothetical protein
MSLESPVPCWRDGDLKRYVWDFERGEAGFLVDCPLPSHWAFAA